MSVASVLAVVYLAVGFAVGLAVHEYAHALAALRLGDPTPKQAGRLTLDLRPHVDRFGTLVLPGILLLVVLLGGARFVFGYAKPQPVNPWALRREDHHIPLIALAGPVANVLLAFVVGALLRVSGGETATFLGHVLIANVILAGMNLMPVPPLDMSRVVARLLPDRAREFMTNMEQYGALFMLLVFFIFPGPILLFARIIGNGICQLVAGGECL